MKIEGSVALVTGANRGIGRAIADELLARGAAKVYAGVRDPATVTDDRLVAVKLDVTDAAGVARAADQLGDVQIVVNNAGIGGGSTPLSVDLDRARTELEVNYLGLVSMTQAFAPILAANDGGAFVNVLSVVSWAAMPSLTSYSASKAAAWSFTNAARVELARAGTEVVGVHVGFVDTDLTAGLPVEKIEPQAVATSALDALEQGRPEALVDDLSRTVKAGLHDDQNLIYPGIADQFNAAAVS
jgi:NAD(P)-dependent dehydrogenase (short-subunit alcohol dehydrogenase family)